MNMRNATIIPKVVGSIPTVFMHIFNLTCVDISIECNTKNNIYTILKESQNVIMMRAFANSGELRKFS